MKNGLARFGGKLIANASKLPWEPSLLHRPRLPSRSRTPGNYRKYPSIRIDNVKERTGANPLTVPAKLLKNNIALSAAPVGAAIKWAAPRGLCGLFRVGA
jgi:hypothetical protein